jgi:hypothetical protein
MIKHIIDKEKLFKYIGYTPMETQRIVHFAPYRFRIDVRGRRSGKSYGSGREAIPSLLVPGSKGCVLAPTYDLCDKVMREIDFIVFQKLKIPFYTRSKIKGSLRYAKLKLGPQEYHSSEVWARSADNPDSILGEGYDWAIVDESARISKVVNEQYFRPTLSERMGWVLYITTPNGFNWLYDAYNRGQSEDPMWKDWMSWKHPTSTSIYISKEELEAAKNELTYQFYEQEFNANFMSFAGQVYGDFNREIHAKYKIDYDSRYDLYCFIDFGYRMPAVLWAQVIQGDTGPKLAIIDEIIHRENITTPELKVMILKRNRQMNYQVTDYFCDPAGSQIDTHTGKNDLEVFADYEIGPSGMNRNEKIIELRYRRDKVATNRNNGIKFIRTLLYNAAGVISLYVSRTCTEFITDLEGYRYPEKKNELSNQPKEEPLKDGRFEHGCDCLRYGCVNLAHLFKNFVYTEGLVK